MPYAAKPASDKKKSLYVSDVGDVHGALTGGLVHEGKMEDFVRKYDMSKATELGHGACGSVVAVRRRDTNDMFALKVISMNSMDKSNFDELRTEIATQKKLDHPNICKVIESFEDPRHGKMYIVMELCSGGSLVSRMKYHRHGYGEGAVATFIESMLSAVTYCHHHGVVHRDIKLDNMIFESEAEDAELKLIDFGFAMEVRVGREGMWEQLGTPSYMAPELWDKGKTTYDSAVDVWAIGVVAYMLLSGKRPFHHQDMEEKRRLIRHAELQFPSPDWDHVSDGAKDFCRALLKKRPHDRLSSADAAQHAWIKSASNMHRGIDAAHELEKHTEIVDSLEAFSHADGLAKLALQVIAFSTPPAKLAELRQIFHKMDEDDSGTLSLEEFKHAMAMHPEIPQERVEQLFNQMDVQHKGEIDYTEFLAATVASSANFAENGQSSILAAFNMLDADHDGYIDKKDLTRAFDGEISEAEETQILKHCDASGRVNFDAFKRVMLAMMQDVKDHENAHTIITKIHKKSMMVPAGKIVQDL